MCDVLSGGGPGICDRGGGSKLAKNSVTYFMDGTIFRNALTLFALLIRSPRKKLQLCKRFIACLVVAPWPGTESDPISAVSHSLVQFQSMTCRGYDVGITVQVVLRSEDSSFTFYGNNITFYD